MPNTVLGTFKLKYLLNSSYLSCSKLVSVRSKMVEAILKMHVAR